MKRIFRLGLEVALASFLTPIANATIVVYSYSGPVSGGTEVDLSPDGFGSGGFVTSFGTITEDLYYDTVAQTLRIAGSVTVSPSSGSFNIHGSWVGDPGGSGSATLTVGNNGSFSFVQEGGNLSVPVSGSGIYDGQAFSGSWNIQIPLDTRIIAVSPTSITFQELQSIGAPQRSGGIYVNGIWLADGVGDGTYYCSWNQGTVVATAVPEPTTLAAGGLLLLPFGAGTLRMLRKIRTA